jgi:hypothetical protein
MYICIYVYVYNIIYNTWKEKERKGWEGKQNAKDEEGRKEGKEGGGGL